jgi:5'-3' exonuclease
MGVPRLFKWIVDNYGKYITTQVDNSFNCCDEINGISIDNFFIDSNAIIHNCAQRVFNYGQNKKHVDFNEDLSYEEKQIMVFEDYYEQIVSLTEKVKPKKILYIAIDGTAPAGKMLQQRQRRFVSRKEAAENEDNNTASFDSCSISPGTTFMYDLRHFITFKLLSCPLFKNKEFKIIFSGENVPGEGEHKIIQYLRKNTQHENENNCMFGPDGDLIMLTLASNCKKFFLLKTDHASEKVLHFLDIEKIRNGIIEDMGIKSKTINDFIFLGFLVGNDFLPKLQMFYMLEDGLKLMTDTYKKLGCEPLITDNNELNIPNIIKFIRELSRNEPYFLNQQVFIKTQDEKFINQTLLNSTLRNDRNNRILCINYHEYRINYNKKIKCQDDKKLNELCKSYLQGLHWVYKYYTEDCLSYKWHFQGYYPPLMFDFHMYLKNNYNRGDRVDKGNHEGDCARNFATFEYEESETFPHSQFQQLLAILPPSSKNLLPKEFNIFYEKDSSLNEFFPEKFEIDYEGKYQDHQGIALLPFIDYDKLKREYFKLVNSKETVKNNKLNSKGTTYLLTYSDKVRNYKFDNNRVRTNVEITSL